MDRTWRFVRRSGAGTAEVIPVPLPGDVGGIDVTLIDPYFGSPITATPLQRLLADLPTEAVDADILILRGVSEQTIADEALDVPVLLEAFSDRTGRSNVGIGLLGLEPASRSMKITWLVEPANAPPNFLEHLRELELLAHLHRTKAVYRSDSYHFQLPSGAHADTYIRLADALDDIWVVRRLADWLESYVTPDTVLLTDTWTILPLLQELSRRSELNGATSPEVLTFSDYPTNETARQILSSVPTLFRNPQTGRLLAIVSVISSGKLLSLWENLAAEYIPRSQIQFVSLVTSGDSKASQQNFSTVTLVSRYASVDVCELCRDPKRSSVVEIDARRYFPKIEVRKNRHMITAKAATEHTPFWQAASRTDAVRVHATDTSTGRPRHFHIDIDVGKLLSDAAFAEEVETSLAAFANRCDVLVVPKHPATGKLIELATRIYPKFKTVVIPRLPLGEEATGPSSRDLIEPALRGAKNILILDDVIVEGKTVRSIHRLIQDSVHRLPVEARPKSDYSIRAFAILGRPESESRWNNLNDSLRQSGGRAHLSSHIKLLIPGSPCPWCEEADYLEGVLRLLARRDASSGDDVSAGLIRRRLAMLRPVQGSTGSGLSSALFLCDERATIGPASPAYLTPHSLFGEGLSEAAAYAAMATTMNSLRSGFDEESSKKNGESWVWDVPRIMGAYHDPILHASFIRAARSRELLFENHAALKKGFEDSMDPARSEELRQSAIVAAEHRLAFLSGKYPLLMRALIAEFVDPVVDAWGGQLSELLAGLSEVHTLATSAIE